MSEKEIIALLPGSRKQEVRKMLCVDAEHVAPYFKDYQFVIAEAPLPKNFILNFESRYSFRFQTKLMTTVAQSRFGNFWNSNFRNRFTKGSRSGLLSWEVDFLPNRQKISKTY